MSRRSAHQARSARRREYLDTVTGIQYKRLAGPMPINSNNRAMPTANDDFRISRIVARWKAGRGEIDQTEFREMMRGARKGESAKARDTQSETRGQQQQKYTGKSYGNSPRREIRDASLMSEDARYTVYRPATARVLLVPRGG